MNNSNKDTMTDTAINQACTPGSATLMELGSIGGDVGANVMISCEQLQSLNFFFLRIITNIRNPKTPLKNRKLQPREKISTPWMTVRTATSWIIMKNKKTTWIIMDLKKTKKLLLERDSPPPKKKKQPKTPTEKHKCLVSWSLSLLVLNVFFPNNTD